MSYLISEIRLQDENYSFRKSADPQGNRIQFLSRINIFLGENNSGKSRLLRSILSNEFDYVPNSSFILDYNNCVEGLKNDFESYFNKKGIDIKGFQNIYKTLNTINVIEYVNKSTNLYENFSKPLQHIKSLENQGNIFSEGIVHPLIAKDLLKIIEARINVFEGNFEDYLRPTDFKKLYIPILRGMKPIHFEEGEFKYDDFYQVRIRKDYFDDGSDVSNNIEIFTGITSYIDIKSFLLGKLNQRKLINEYEKYLSENFFDDQEVTLIPSQLNGLVTIKIGDEAERPIYELGDGIQSIIILTLPLFLNKGNNLLVFIEEPEKLLHPGLQRRLIETLLKQEGFENYHYFMTTHSNHFLDITFDFPEISIYALTKKVDEGDGDEKEPKFLIENLKHGDTSALELLGVRNSSVFLSNCTIWVEGITDRLYFRHYLNLYFDHLSKSNISIRFKEDFHYSFVEYSGGNITHWSFLDNEEYPMNVERLCGRLFLIADKDHDKDKRHEQLKEKLDGRFCLLSCREVENLISKKVLLKVIEDYEGCSPEMEIIEEEDYHDKLLGQFIDERLGINRKRKGSYAAESGTVSDKLGFCKKAIKYTSDWDDLSDETKDICKKIFQFIAENNN